MGMSMNSSSSANATISSYFSWSWSRRSPAARPPRVTFSRPLRSLLKPTPRASSVETRPRTSTRPEVGGRMPAIVRTRVDLPAPFAPTMPSTEPCCTSSDTFLTASSSCTIRSRRPSRSSVLLNVGFFSSDVRYVTDTSSTRMAGGAPGRGVAAGPAVLETDSELTLPRHEEQGTGDEQDHAPGQAEQHVPRGRRLTLVEHVAPCGQQRADRVDLEQRLVAVRHLLRVVEDRRRVQPDPQDVGQEALDVAEVDLQRSHEHREPRGDKRQAEDD